MRDVGTVNQVSRTYEQIVWRSLSSETDDAEKSTRGRLAAQVSIRGSPQLMQRVLSYAKRPGPLNFGLARWSEGTDQNPAPVVVGELIGLLGQRLASGGRDDQQTVERAVRLLSPVIRWDNGFQPLYEGLRALGDDKTLVGAMLELDPAVTRAILEAIWAVGVLRIARRGDAADKAAGAILETRPERQAIAAVHSEVLARAAGSFSRLAQRVARRVAADPRRIGHKLWQNALAMAVRHEADEDAGCAAVMGELLSQVASGRGWPLCSRANDRFRESILSDEARGFWLWNPRRDFQHPRLGPVRVCFLRHPLVLLHIGNAFDTCLRLRGGADRELLGWATNVNVRLAAVIGHDGRIIARKTIGLRTTPSVGIRQAPTYPRGSRVVCDVLGDFVSSFAENLRLPKADEGDVKPTSAPAYRDWKPWDCDEEYAAQVAELGHGI